MADDRLVKGYAQAIFAIAEAEGDLGSVEDELFRFGRIVEARARLREALADATGRNVELRVIVDDAVIGGVAARVGDQVFDGTVRRKLEVAREQLTRAR